MSTDDRDAILVEILRRLKRMELRSYRIQPARGKRAEKQDRKDLEAIYTDEILTKAKSRRHEKVSHTSRAD